jgi:hypothetical protein
MRIIHLYTGSFQRYLIKHHTSIHRLKAMINDSKKALIRTVCTVLFLMFTLSAHEYACAQKLIKTRPFRALLVIGDQWDDPAGYLVGLPSSTGEYSGYGEMQEVKGEQDFHNLVVLLKSWCIPFDIVRLDQQYLDRNMFLDMDGKLRYGTIIWDVNSPESILHQDYSVITEMVKDTGIGLIAISDRISQPEIQVLLGLKYIGSWESVAKPAVKTRHFITEQIISPMKIDSATEGHMQRQQVEILNGTQVIAEQGEWPLVTVREYPSGAHVAWFGNDHNYLFTFQGIRTMFRRAVCWTIGFSIHKTWENQALMVMDDPGGASSSWLGHWHYPTLSEEQIGKFMIEPLLKHKAVLNINFVPGFVNDSLKRIEPAWQRSYTDKFGTRQDYISSKKGYDKGISLGVFTVMSHGFTHMQPDLESPPGWYGSALDRERAEVGWYREFGDTRRYTEIPGAEQLWRMKISAEWLTRQFGVEPLEFCPGGLGTSVSYFNNTARLAGQAGYGWNGWLTGYLGKDLAVTGWKYFGTPDSPAILPVLPDGHDFGISREPQTFARIFDLHPKLNFISFNEFIGYLHSGNSGYMDLASGSLSLNLEYDGHYCRYFADHESEWTIELSDWLLAACGQPSSVSVDGKKNSLNNGKLVIPAGTGQHRVSVGFDRGGKR